MIRRFNRYELKYIISTRKCWDLIQELPGHVTPDSYGGTGGYDLVSLYYDSGDLASFWAKIDGIRYRRKVRLRIYPELNIETTSRAMVEIKQRMNRTVQKRRLELPLHDAERLCDGDWTEHELDQLNELDRAVASEVMYLSSTLQLRPTAITTYHRLAFTGTGYEPGLRITFDFNLGGRVDALRVNRAAHNRPIMDSGWCVMEIKSDDRVPDWVTSLLARHHCQLQRVSKYCAVVARFKSLGSNARAMAAAGMAWNAEGFIVPDLSNLSTADNARDRTR